MNHVEIKRLKKELSYEKKVNLDLIAEIKDIKTDSFVMRYAVDNLNLKPDEKDIVDLKITDEELDEIKLRMQLGIFGKKYEHIQTPKNEALSDESNDISQNLDNNEDVYNKSESLNNDENLNDNNSLIEKQEQDNDIILDELSENSIENSN